MTRDDVAETVMGVISDLLGCCADDISIDDHLIADLDCDGGDLAALAARLEEEFEQSVAEHWPDDGGTVNSLVDAVCAAVGVTP